MLFSLPSPCRLAWPGGCRLTGTSAPAPRGWLGAAGERGAAPSAVLAKSQNSSKWQQGKEGAQEARGHRADTNPASSFVTSRFFFPKVAAFIKFSKVREVIFGGDERERNIYFSTKEVLEEHFFFSPAGNETCIQASESRGWFNTGRFQLFLSDGEAAFCMAGSPRGARQHFVAC